MSPTVPSPFVGARTYVFRRYITLRYQLGSAKELAAKAARRARKLEKIKANNERLCNFFAWWEGCAAYGSIF